jgi:hypothetical protein
MPLCGFNAKMLYGLSLINESVVERLGGIKMPFCGTNVKMIYGASLFNEGLVEHGMIDRSVSKGLSLDQVFDKELSEMDEFLREIPNIENEAFRQLIQGTALHARAIYVLLNPEQVRNGTYRTALKNADDVLYGMDNHFYAQLEHQPDRMKKLVGWINAQTT